MGKQTGTIDLRPLREANGKNRIYYQSSEPSGGVSGDTWFDTGNGFEIYRYNGNEWVKAGLSSAVFSTFKVGDASVGTLKSLLIFNDDDYWNLSDTDITIGQKTYESNTLKTSHLIAREDIDVQGGTGSVIKIPTNSSESDAYTELAEGGLKNVSVYGYKKVTTRFPSDSDETVMWAIQEYSGATGFERVGLSMDALQYDVYDVSYMLDHHRAYYGADSMQIYDGVNSSPVIFLQGSMKQVRLGSAANKISLSVNGGDISKIAEAYPTQSGKRGAVALQVEPSLAKYSALGIDATRRRVFFYASDDPDDLTYLGRVDLI